MHDHHAPRRPHAALGLLLRREGKSSIAAHSVEEASAGPNVDLALAPFVGKKGHAMSKLLGSVRKFLKSEEGPTAVEYAVMLALIVVVCLTAIQAIGTNANATFQSVAAQLPTGGAS